MNSRWFVPGPDSILQRAAFSRGATTPPHWLPLLMLVWTFWLFFTPLSQTGDGFPHWMWPTLVSFCIFLPLYFRIYYRSRSQAIWCIVGIALLGYAISPFNPGAQTYVIYACAYTAFARSTRAALSWLAAILSVYSIEWVVLLHFDWSYLLNCVLISLAITFMNMNYLRKQQRESELLLSNEEVRRLAATAERERIGRDLHDLLGHTLSLITLKSELANRLFDRDVAAAKREMLEVERIARDALAQVRRAVTGIRAAGFAAELASAKLLLESNGVRLDYRLPALSMPVEIETVLAMVIREAVTNVQRHAQATRTRVFLESEGGTLHLRIEDDGRGGDIVPGNGLCGMRERLSTIGAQLRVDSTRGAGTRLHVSLPFAASAVATDAHDTQLRPT